MSLVKRVDGWQPIETAPKAYKTVLVYGIGADGRPVIQTLAWGCREHGCLSYPIEPACDWRNPRKDCDWAWGQWGVDFTHWMPLPSPPASLQPRGQG